MNAFKANEQQSKEANMTTPEDDYPFRRPGRIGREHDREAAKAYTLDGLSPVPAGRPKGVHEVHHKAGTAPFGGGAPSHRHTLVIGHPGPIGHPSSARSSFLS